MSTALLLRSYLMNPSLKEIRRNPVLWLLAFRARSIGRSARQAGSAHAAFVLSVLAIVPLAALLSPPQL
jgi:Ca2+:H+ antiporter